MKYRVLKISNNVREYPECEQDSIEFPHLVEHLGDEMDIFIMNEKGAYCLATEFFNTVDVREFEIIYSGVTK